MYKISKEPKYAKEYLQNLFKINVTKVCDMLKATYNVPKNSVILLKGTSTLTVNDEDIEYWDVHQNTHFYYTFGVQLLDCYGVIEVDEAKQVLFMPKANESDKLWTNVQSKEEVQEETLLDQVCYFEEMESYFKQKNPSIVYLNDGINSDSGLSPEKIDFPFMSQLNLNSTDLFPVITECRVIKNEFEIELLKYITQISCEAHVQTMQNTLVGMKEYQLHAMFEAYIRNHSNGMLGYMPICAAGKNCSILHYTKNDTDIDQNHMILSDMGGKWRGYVADVTVSYPANGKFNEQQRNIYSAVLDATNAVMDNLKEGVNWDDMHLLAEKQIITHLKKIGIFKSEYSIEEIQDARMGAIFMPHGLGHLIGLQVHDVGGYNKSTCPPRLTLDGLNRIRTRREMKENMTMTVEPGCYFIEFLLEKVRKDERGKYINWDICDQYKNFGGVRIEDDVIIQKNSVINMSGDLPRTIEQIENCMAGKAWK